MNQSIVYRLLSVVLSTVVCFSSAFAQQAEKTDEQYWAETAIVPLFNEVFSTLFSPGQTGCYESPIIFKACFKTLNTLTRAVDLKVLPVTMSQDEDLKAGALVVAYGDVGLYQSADADSEGTPSESLSIKSRWEKNKALEKRLDAAYETAFMSSQKIDFSNFFTEFSNRYMQKPDMKQKAPFLFAQVVNQYIQLVEDAHGHVDARAIIEKQNASADSSITGIGIQYENNGNNVLIVAVTPGGPAEKAGLLENDLVTHVDGKTLEAIGKDNVPSAIKGPIGTTVVLTVLRDGKTFDLSIVRDKVKIEGVKAKMLENFGQKIAHIQFLQFMGDDLCEQIKAKTQELEKNGAQGLILDLRNNGGGRLDLAVCIGGLFVGKKLITKVKDLQTNQFKDLISKDAQITRLPMAVLINRNSASASELVSGALRDHNRAYIVGETSFGKGSVQGPTPLDPQQTLYLYRTIARFYQPSGTTNQSVGIGVDVAVPFKPDATEDELFALREMDLFPNALTAEGEVWKPEPGRIARMKKINDCVDQGQLAKKKYTSENSKKIKGMYEVYTAEEVLSCHKSLKLQVQQQKVKIQKKK